MKYIPILCPDFVGGTPSDPQSWNRYAYCRGNPIVFIDITGLYKLIFKGNWVDREIEIVESTIKNIEKRAKKVIKNIKEELKKLKKHHNCQRACKNDPIMGVKNVPDIAINNHMWIMSFRKERLMIRKGEVMDIWTLYRQGYSYRAIARRLGLDRRTVKRYIEAEGFPKYKKRKRSSKLDSYHGLIRDWLEEDDYTATWIHDRLKLQGFTGSYDLVKRFVRREKSRKARLAYVRFETEPGLQAQVDFSEFRIIEADGRESTIYLFALVLGYSRVMYGEFVNRCIMKNFLECHQRAFGYIGGVPGEILYDNMKNVVIRRLVGRIEWNVRFLDFAGHYRFKPVVCPPYSPWYKGKVERPFDYIRERFWRGRRYINIEQANCELLKWMDQTANRRIHGTMKENVAKRWDREKALLGNIPCRSYDTSDVYYRKVYKDCFVRFRCNSYRVPHRMVGKRVIIKVNDDTLRIYHNNELLKVYLLVNGRGQFIEDKELLDSLLNDKEMLRRKYRKPKSKGKATRGLVKDKTDYEGLVRELGIYDELTGVSS